MKKSCGNCGRSDKYCICVVCEDGNMVVCQYKGKHVKKEDCCEDWKPEVSTHD